ncbi:MAG: NdvB, partial [Acidobacteria bacterium]|nr:NdvB [Acidobacteriota bacterium]
SFVAELARRLQGHGPALALPLTWIAERLSESGQTIERLVQSESQQLAADQVSISNSIGSLRFLGAMDWREFVERMSVVEHILREDPDGVYGKMDFATRDRYRHVVEKVAKESRLSESEVARKAIQLAREDAAGKGSDDRAAHVGFYLIDKGLPQLEELAHIRWSVSGALRKVSSRFPLSLYLGTITLVTLTVTGSLLATTLDSGLQDWQLALTVILSLLCASHMAVALVNWLATLLARPHLLPRMDFSGGIPPESRTLAVIPTMLTSAQNVEDLVEALEVRFLANRDENLQRERKRQHLLPLSPSAPMEPPGADLDGLRAQAREACGIKCSAARWLKGILLMHRRGYRGLIEREVCNHP